MGWQPLVGQGLLIVEASRSHSDTPHSLGLLWTSDLPVAHTSTWQHTTLKRDRDPCPRRDSNPQSQKASGGTGNRSLRNNRVIIKKAARLALTEPQEVDFFSGAGRFLLMQVLEILIFGTPDYRYCERLPRNTHFHYACFRFRQASLHRLSGSGNQEKSPEELLWPLCYMSKTPGLFSSCGLMIFRITVSVPLSYI
jgi:hypothetical protein